MTVREWEQTDACKAMYRIDPTIWVPAEMMSEKDKAEHSKWETIGGFLKTIPMKEAWSNFWNNADQKTRDLFTSLENFDAEIFEEITGIKI